jgi:hypothetical protein
MSRSVRFPGANCVYRNGPVTIPPGLPSERIPLFGPLPHDITGGVAGLDIFRARGLLYRFFITLTFRLKWALGPTFFFHNSNL